MWPLPRAAVAELGWLATVGTLPASVRARLRIQWSAIDEIRLRAIAQAFKLLNVAHGAAFESQYAASRGDVLAAKKQTADARAAYKLALDKAGKQDAAFRETVRMRLDALGGADAGG